MKYELAYSDFDSIKLTGTGGDTNTVTADADALTFESLLVSNKLLKF